MSYATQYSVFTKEEFHYCVPIDQVREVIRTQDLIQAPVQAPGFLGYLDFRKTLCPVLDIPTLIPGQVARKHEGAFTLMVLEWESHLFAVLIDRFVESFALEESQAAKLTDDGSHRRAVAQVFRYRGRALNRLDLGFLRNHVATHLHDQLDGQSKSTSASDAGTEDLDEMEMICFGLDHLKFGIPISDLVEVVEGYSVEPLFRTNSFLRGLINLRGQIIACVDISEVIGLTNRRMEEKNQYILLQHQDRDLALCIDSISKKQKYLRSQILDAGHIFDGELSDYLLGIIETGQDRIFVISGPKIFASKHLVAYQE